MHTPSNLPALVAILSACLAVTGCDDKKGSSDGTESPAKTAAADVEPTAETAAKDSEGATKEASDKGDPCSQVKACCEAMGKKFGGGALKKCEAAASGSKDECEAYIDTQRTNQKEFLKKFGDEGKAKAYLDRYPDACKWD
jgi:hypothetical protein